MTAGRKVSTRGAKGRAGFQIRHILVPTDFSPASRKVLEFASGFAANIGAEVTVIHVLEPVPQADSRVLPAVLSRGRDLKETQQALESFARQSVGADVLKNTKVYAGRAYEQIAKAARNLKADVIVIGTHGYGAKESDVVGSTTERIVRYARCPVLTVHPPTVRQ